MASSSKQELEQQLGRLQAQLKEGGDAERVAKAALSEFGMSPNQLADMDTHKYFVALLQGLDRTKAELRNRQIEELKGATIDRIDKSDHGATVHWKTSSGQPMSDSWIQEDGNWRVIADVN